MKLWMSGEIQSDVADTYRMTRAAVEAAVNTKLQSLTLSTPIQKWAFIAIMRADEDPDYPEVKNRTQRGSVVEFRLKLDHKAFLNGDAGRRKNLVVEALKRSVELMSDFGIHKADRHQLLLLLEELNS